MINKRLIAVVVAAMLTIPAIAQIAPIRINRPLPPQGMSQIQVQTEYRPLLVDPANDPERARALISKLQKDKRAMREKAQQTLMELQNARYIIDEMTRQGGSLVRAQCVGDTLSRTTAGAEENCAASGYTCAGSEGTCHRQCSSSKQCAPGFLCDTGAGRCVTPPPPADDDCSSFWDFC